ncbi:hypothetical protein ACP70R_037474 [Stipagrostis hirtigluma subsp. patula]
MSNMGKSRFRPNRFRIALSFPDRFRSFSSLAGPTVFVSGVSAKLSVFCYTEFAVKIPVAGGSLAYLRVELGDFMAFIAAGIILLEYCIGGALVARSGTSCFTTLLNHHPNDFRIHATSLAEDYSRVDPIAVAVITLICFFAVVRIYVEDGMVIHFTRAAGHEIRTGTFLDWFLFSSSPETTEGPPCQKYGHLIKRQGVIMSCLDCFLDGGSLYLFSDYAVSPAFFLAKARGGTCTLAASDPSDVVIHRAQYLLNNGFGMYCLFKNNYEDFAIYCKTGLLVETAFSVGCTAAFSAVALSPLRFLTTSAGGLAIVTSIVYCVDRYVSDIGVRRDVIKVPVERLVEHWGQIVVASPPQARASEMEVAARAPSDHQHVVVPHGCQTR